jgi:hypothetical protein
MCMFLRFVAKMSDRFLGKQINIRFRVKLRKNASDTCSVLSQVYGGEAVKESSILFEW